METHTKFYKEGCNFQDKVEEDWARGKTGGQFLKIISSYPVTESLSSHPPSSPPHVA